MITRAEAERLLDFARAHGIAILSDEVYHRLVYEGLGSDRGVAFSFLRHRAPSTDPVFVVNSFSEGLGHDSVGGSAGSSIRTATMPRSRN